MVGTERPDRVTLRVLHAPVTSAPMPANARVEAWWPQADILTQAALLLGHGGFGTTMGALTAGVPQVVAPIFTSDQIINARHVAAVGAGRAVPSGPGRSRPGLPRGGRGARRRAVPPDR